jgi:hypothetical protein
VVLASPDLFSSRNPDFLTGLKPIALSSMPAGIRIFSNQPDRCLRSVAGWDG